MANEFFNNIRILPRDNAFLTRNVGSSGQVFYNKDTNSLQVYDGIATGGYELSSEKNLIKLISNKGIATIKFVVTAGAAQGGDTGNKFYIDSAYKPALSFIRGYTYVFDQSDSTNLYYPNSVGGTYNQHPLHFSSNDADGELGDGSAYTAGVVYLLDDIEVTRSVYISKFRFASQRKVIITVTEATPNTLYYYCSSHIGMGSTAVVNDPGTGSGSGGASIDVSDTAPSSPTAGSLWLNTTNGVLYVYQSGVWIQPSYDIPSTFSTITTSDSSSLTPTGYDTLNLREGSNVELVSDPITNTITINVVGLSEIGGVDLTAFSVGAEGTPSGNGELQYNNTTGVFTFVPPVIPAALTDLGIADGTVGQVLTTDGAGGFTFEDAAGGASIGAFVFTGSNIDTNDSSSITLTPALSVQSDLTVENDLIVRNDVVLDGNLVTQGSGTPELVSDNEILLTATTRVSISATPIKLASFTTAQRDLLSAQNGDLIYNTTLNKFQGYENGAWANLI